MDISDYNEVIFTSWFKLQEQIPLEFIRENELQVQKRKFLNHRARLKELCSEFAAYQVSVAASSLSVKPDKLHHSTPVQW